MSGRATTGTLKRLEQQHTANQAVSGQTSQTPPELPPGPQASAAAQPGASPVSRGRSDVEEHEHELVVESSRAATPCQPGGASDLVDCTLQAALSFATDPRRMSTFCAHARRV